MSVDDRDLCQCPMCGRLHKNLNFGKPPMAIAGPSLLQPAERLKAVPPQHGDEYHAGEGVSLPQLRCPGIGRDKDCVSALEFYFNRRVTDDEMRFLKDVMDRAVACMPKTQKAN